MFRYDRVTQQLLDEISHMSPNTRIPSRTQLGEKYGVTRTTIDKAISSLTNKGYLYSVKGSGTYVTPQSKISVLNENNGPLTWGVIMPDIMYGLYTAILRGVSDIANLNNISVTIFNTDNDAKRQHEYVKMLVDSGVNGVIIIPAITDEFIPETYALLREKHIPFVFCNRNIESMPEVPFVCSNNFYGAYIGVKHLIAQGYKKIAFLSKKRYSSMLERYHGYIAALLEHGCEVCSKFIIMQYNDEDALDDYKVSKELFEGEDHPDGIFCAYEGMVPQLYKALEDLNLKVSDDVGIISYDSSNICDTLSPRLTAVSFQSYQAGYQSALILMDMMQNKFNDNTNIYILQPGIDFRQSCLGKIHKNNEPQKQKG